MAQQLRQTISFIVFFSLLTVIFALPMFASTLSSTDSASVDINYTLPYPGLLPDNPLYVFKAIRDKIVSILISDPKNKAEFDLLQADKRLSAAFALSKKQPANGQLVVTTISKGENYFSEAVGQATLAHSEGIEVNGLIDRLGNAAEKHQQIILGIENGLSKKDSEQLALEATRVVHFLSQAKKIRSQK